jgi:ketosteroid isomerase-like protein
MKKLVMTLLCMAFSLLAFAQSTFTEKMFTDMMGRYQKETVLFLKTEASPDFIFLGSDGQTMNHAQFLAFVQGGTFITNEFTDLKIRQFDNTAIVTGIWSHSHQLKHDNSFVAFKELVTETFVQQNGKWLLVSHQGTVAPTVKADEEAAIKAVIEKETATWRAGDIKGHADCWQPQPYSRILIAMTDGSTLDVPAAFMLNPTPDIMGNGGISVNTNYRISINGNTAWSSHDQETTEKDGTKSYSYEMRMLEKINGAWKIVGESVHHHRPK